MYLGKTRPPFRWISCTDTYKPHLALISAQMLERERERKRERGRERERERERESLREIE